MSGFVRDRRTKHIVATFSVFEADLLRSLAAQLVELLHNEAAVARDDEDPLAALFDFTGPVTEPEDPVLLRLFPNAYRGDEEAAGEFRRYTESTLRDSKSRAAGTVIDGLEEAGLPTEPTGEELTLDVELSKETAQVWMRSFTDMRLALATRLGVEEDDEEYWETLDDDDPRAQAHHIYEWVGYLQETLVMAVSSKR